MGGTEDPISLSNQGRNRIIDDFENDQDYMVAETHGYVHACFKLNDEIKWIEYEHNWTKTKYIYTLGH